VLLRAVAGVVDLAVFEREGTGELVRAEDAVAGTGVDLRVAHGDVVRALQDAARAAAGDLETFEHDVVGLAELDRVGAPGDVRALAGDADAAEHHRVAGAAAVLRADHDVARIGGVAVDLDDVASFEIDVV